MSNYRFAAAIAMTIVCIALLPYLAGPFTSVLVSAGIFGILVVGLDLVIGYTGQLALGHTAFFAIGAYGSAVMVTKYGLPPILTLAISVVVACIVAYLVGIPTLRLRGIYFGVATLSFAIIVVNILVGWLDVTGGAGGLRYIPTFSVGGFSFASERDYLYLSWGSFAVISYLSFRMLNSRPGRALKAVHDDEIAARSLGIDLFKCKIQVFTLAAAYAAIAGGLYAHYMKFIAPASFDLEVLVMLLLMLFLGGQRTLWGAIIGAITVRMLPELVGWLHDFSTLAYGLIFLAVLFFLPGGIAGALETLFNRIRRNITARGPAAPQDLRESLSG